MRLICNYCNKEFNGAKSQKFCSRDCVIKSQQKYSREPRKCLNCSKLYIPHSKSQKFCSNNCNNHYRKGKPLSTTKFVTKQCEWCGKEFQVRISSRKRFCNPTCSAFWRNKHFPKIQQKRWSKEHRLKQSKKLSEFNLNPKNNKIIRKRMKENNPMYKKEIIQKMLNTKQQNNTIRIY